MSKITKDKWKKELIHYNKSVAWIAPNGKKYSLWSKVPHQDENGELIMVDNDKMSTIYYDWISKNMPVLLHDNSDELAERYFGIIDKQIKKEEKYVRKIKRFRAGSDGSVNT